MFTESFNSVIFTLFVSLRFWQQTLNATIINEITIKVRLIDFRVIDTQCELHIYNLVPNSGMHITKYTSAVHAHLKDHCY